MREWLARAARALPDIVLLDVNMPGLDGFETCRRLKADPATREIPVIFVTALDEVADKVAGLEAGSVVKTTLVALEGELVMVAEVTVKPPSVAVSVQVVPVVMVTALKVATPATALTVVVPVRVQPLVMVIASVLTGTVVWICDGARLIRTSF